ncbi:hypothetical protein PR048_010336 [Dryococelus australis]|uniref:Uncharacterized protein n=1 Tax=Dryococelus australis TaxID=614101 RepID=A0ABQ9I2W8_9NEOP|nr:hypothetical protein PR048_010336 [Dryococelus australis]
MVQVYGEVFGNNCAAHLIYQEWHPFQCVPHNTTADEQARRFTVGTLAFEEDILRRVERNPATCTHAIACRMCSSTVTVWRVRHNQSLFSYHWQQVQVMGPRDYPQYLQFT